MFRRVLAVLALLLTLTGCDRASQTAASEFIPEPAPLATARPTTVPTTAPETVPSTTAPPETTAPETVPPEPERFVLTFAGDCTLGGSTATQYALCGFPKTVGEDYGYPFRNVQEYFANDDLTLVNLEGTLGDQGTAAEKTYVFRGSEAYVNILTEGSVEAVSLANNHTMDYGQSGYDTTRDLVTQAGVVCAERRKPLLYTTASGLRVGIYADSFYHGGSAQLEEGFAQLRQDGAEIVIYFTHWGSEYAYTPDAEQIRVAHMAIDAGADIVVGSHPHVLQPVEEYGGGMIFYSLGNFCFGGNTDPRDYDTAVIQQQVLRHPDGAVTLGETTYIPASLSSDPDVNNYQPTPYPEGSGGYERVMAKLNGTWAS